MAGNPKKFAVQQRSIQLLSGTLRNQIAAGEVVERPASVLKELLENSLDAGALDINISLEDGGLRLISVKDNGFGIPEEELELALTRHATSKVQTFAELLHVSSFGFRGEALASIASVAEVRLESICSRKAKEHSTQDNLGAFLEVHHGEKAASGISPLQAGTLVVVRDIFANVPARLKFLKNPSTELKKCQEVVMRMALARTDVAFSLYAGGREVFAMPANATLLDRLAQIWPGQIVQDLVAVDNTRHEIRVHGYASLPQSAQGRGDRLLLYVNQRPVQDKLLLRAVREAYKGRLTSKEYPQVVLFLEIAPEEIDVNVHPAKTEVRFRDERSVFGAVLRALEQAFIGVDFGISPAFHDAGLFPALGVKESKDGEELVSSFDSGRFLQGELDKKPLPEERPLGFWGNLDNPRLLEKKAVLGGEDEGAMNFSFNRHAQAAAFETVSPYLPNVTSVEASLSSEQSTLAYGHDAIEAVAAREQGGKEAFTASGANTGYPFKLGNFTCFGQVEATYLLGLRDGRLVLIDQHAAHERVLLHKIESNVGKAQCQLLAMPVDWALHQSEEQRLTEKYAELQGMGFSLVRDLGKITIKGVPQLLSMQQGLDFLRAVLADRVENLNEKLHSMACKTAIKAGQVLTADEAAGLLAQWLATPNYQFCPHGRPVFIEIGKAELERMFKRIVP